MLNKTKIEENKRIKVLKQKINRQNRSTEDKKEFNNIRRTKTKTVTIAATFNSDFDENVITENYLGEINVICLL